MKSKFTLPLAILLILFFFSAVANAQSVKRQTIGSFGSGGFIEGAFISQTIGQPYFTSGHFDNEVSVAPGFQQPFSYLSNRNMDVPLLEGLTVYPNPASGYFIVETKEILESAVIKITDLNGRLVTENTVTNLQRHRINCSHLPRGMYFITVASGINNQKHISKIIISK